MAPPTHTGSMRGSMRRYSSRFPSRLSPRHAAAARRVSRVSRALSGSDSLFPSSYSSSLVSRYDFAQFAGLTFDGQRNLDEALGYSRDRDLGISAYRRLYERGGIASRIVNAYPQATWTGGATIYEDEDPNVITEFESAIESLFQRLDFWSVVMRADILAGLGEYGAILIGAPVVEVGDLTSDVTSVLVPTSSPDDILYLSPLAQDRIAIKSKVKDPSDPRYGQVDTYRVILDDGDSEVAFGSPSPRLVHWSRVIHIAEGCLESDLYGEPRLRAVWDDLTDLKKVKGGGSEAAWRRMDPGFQVNLDPELQLDAEEEEALDAEIEEYQHNLSRVIRTRGVTMNPLSAGVVNFGPNVDTLIKLISATTGIPYRILSGSERGELASSQDRDNWSDRVAERRARFAEPLIRKIVDRFLAMRVIPRPRLANNSYQIAWPEIEEIDEKSKHDIALSIANANKAQVFAEGKPIKTSDEIRETVFGMGPLEMDQDQDPNTETDSGNTSDSADTADTVAARRFVPRHWSSRKIRR